LQLTDYHAKYFAYELTKRCSSDSLEKLAGAVAGAQVDLNPHQIDAALFAFRSPLSRGALLADEVGLGKTIEAGLVLAQRWAERKRRILVITPANLRKQWHQELSEKFFLPCRILEAKPYNEAIKRGIFQPFNAPNSVVICSYQFARSKAADVATTPWDLVVIDEAHRLRNVYKPTNVIANTLRRALEGRHKLLLTATPLQNSLLELFGLVSIIDDHTFGDLRSFREQFANLSQAQVFQTLQARLRPLCHRTLRRQAAAYVPFTRRHPLVEEFTPDESEDRLYDLVSEYLRRPNLQALPASQRSLMTLVLRKLLASSTFAIAGALSNMAKRLRAQLEKREPTHSLDDPLAQDYEALPETSEEWGEEEPSEPISTDDRAAIEAEIADLEEFARLATSIDHNAKGIALLSALRVAFAKAKLPLRHHRASLPRAASAAERRSGRIALAARRVQRLPRPQGRLPESHREEDPRRSARPLRVGQRRLQPEGGEPPESAGTGRAAGAGSLTRSPDPLASPEARAVETRIRHAVRDESGRGTAAAKQRALRVASP
jgi:adenine-specific DNA-methyltransferase